MFELVPEWASHYEEFWLTIRKRNLWFIKLRYGAVLMLLISIFIPQYILGVVLTLLFVQEVALIELLKSYYRKAIIGRKIKSSDKETLQKIMDELHNGKTWEGQDFFVKLFSMYPFQGLLYTTEFIIPVLIALVILEPAITPEITKISIVTIYLGIIALQKLVHFISFIWKIKKSMFITKAIERMQIK